MCITSNLIRLSLRLFCKAISEINQAYKLSIDQNSGGSAEEFLNMGAKEYFKKFWQPYLKVVTYCEDYKQCGYQNNRPYYILKGNLLGSDLIAGSSRIAFITMDGFIFNIRTSEWDLDSNTGFTKTTGSGECCAEKIRRAGWKIDSSYPW